LRRTLAQAGFNPEQEEVGVQLATASSGD